MAMALLVILQIGGLEGAREKIKWTDQMGIQGFLLGLKFQTVLMDTMVGNFLAFDYLCVSRLLE
jgi:hypothetical protein